MGDIGARATHNALFIELSSPHKACHPDLTLLYREVDSLDAFIALLFPTTRQMVRTELLFKRTLIIEGRSLPRFKRATVLVKHSALLTGGASVTVVFKHNSSKH
jgi:hypothetical protein